MNNELVVAGVVLHQDENGLFNLNALHKASGLGKAKQPSNWLRLDSTSDLIKALGDQASDLRTAQIELETQNPNSGSAQKVINSVNGGVNPGTYAHELLATSYAGWISPQFQLMVNQVFIDYRTGKLAPVKELSTIEILQLAMDAEKKNIALEHVIEENSPKVAFANQVEISPDAISIGEAAKLIGTGRNRLLSFMRANSWVNRLNEPYQEKITSGYLDVKLGKYEHPEQGLKQSVTTLVTGRGLAKLNTLING